MRTPLRSSGWAAGTGLAAMAVAVLSLRSLEADSLVRWLLIGLAATAGGAVLSLTTKVGRFFLRVSATLAAAVVAMAGFFVIGVTGMATEGSLLVLWVIIAAVVGVDLCWASRIRLLTLLSGLLLLPLVVSDPLPALGWVLSWIVLVLATFWLLDGDAHRQAEQPEPPLGESSSPARRPVDLLRIVGFGLTVAAGLALTVGDPSCSLQPLADLGRHLPWPDRVPGLRFDEGLAVPLLDLEIDGNGHETRYLFDPRGRRFVESLAGDMLAVVEVDGLDRFVDADGRVRARFLDDGSLLVTGSNGEDQAFERDDEGWFLTVDGRIHRVGIDWFDAPVTLRDVNGEPMGWAADDVVHLDPATAPSALLERFGTTIAVPPEAVVLATAGIHPRVTRSGDIVTIIDEVLSNERVYDRSGDLTVEIDLDDGDRLRLEFDGSRSKMRASSEELGSIGTVPIDRKGNVFDLPPQRSDRDSWFDDLGRFRPLVVAAVVVAALILAAWLLRRWRRGVDAKNDPTWAEEQVRRLEAIGRGHGIERGRAQSVIAFGARLDIEVDESSGRLIDIVDILDTALFGDRPLTDTERTSVETVIDTVADERPALRRRERREQAAHAPGVDS